MLVNIKAPTLQADVSDTGSPSPNSWTVASFRKSTSMSAWRTDPACKPVRGSTPSPKTPIYTPSSTCRKRKRNTSETKNSKRAGKRREACPGTSAVARRPKHQGKLGGYWAARSQQQGHKVLKEILKGTKKASANEGQATLR